MNSARAAAIQHMEMNAPEYFVKAMLDAGLIDEMPERFKKDDTPEEKVKDYYEEEFIASHPKTAAAMQKMKDEGYKALTPCEKCKVSTQCESCCRECPPEKQCNVQQPCGLEEVQEPDKAAETAPTTEQKESAAIQMKGIEAVIEILEKQKELKEEWADICKDEDNGQEEAIARAAVDFFDELIDYAAQEIENIGNSL